MCKKRAEHPRKIKVLIIGTHDLFRDSLQDLLSMQSDMELIGTVGSVQQLPLQPDVILIDLSITEMESLTTIRQIQQTHPHTPIVAMSGFPTNEAIEQMIDAGVKRFIKRGEPASTIVDAVRAL